MQSASEILSILDACCERFTFPMLDNGYVYLAATRLCLFRSEVDWAMTLEVFGFSPRGGVPDVSVATFASTLANRNTRENYASDEAFASYLLNNPHNEFQAFYPIDTAAWQDPDCCEVVAPNAEHVVLRGRRCLLPTLKQYAAQGIKLEEPKPQVFETSRYLAGQFRDLILATEAERRAHILTAMMQVLQLDEWHHPDLCNGERTSGSATFQQLAQVLATGDISHYHPTVSPNTHWSNWPEGGLL